VVEGLHAGGHFPLQGGDAVVAMFVFGSGDMQAMLLQVDAGTEPFEDVHAKNAVNGLATSFANRGQINGGQFEAEEFGFADFEFAESDFFGAGGESAGPGGDADVGGRAGGE